MSDRITTEQSLQHGGTIQFGWNDTAIRAQALDLAVKLVGSGQVATSTPTGTTLDIAENFESYLKGDLA